MSAFIFFSSTSSATYVNTKPEPSKLTEQKKEAIIQKMNRLLWLAEHNQDQRAEALAKGEMLFYTYPEFPELQPLKARLTRHLQWLLFTNIDNSAGVRYFKQTHWRPEGQLMRVRKALTPALSEREFVLTAEGRLVYTLKSQKKVHLGILMRVADVPFLSPASMTVQYQLDNQKPKQITFTPNQVRTKVCIYVPSGEHLLKVEIVNPVFNQYLILDFEENGLKPVFKQFEEIYYIATTKQPVQFKMVGPVLIRIDEKREHQFITRYHFVPAGEHTLDLLPSRNRAEGLFRVSQRIEYQRVKTAAPRYNEVSYQPVLPPYDTLPTPKSPKEVYLHDGLKLGGQEDGTWSYSLGEIKRKNVLERDVSDLDLEEFLEPKLSYHIYNEHLNTYFTSTMKEHIRRYGGATLGLVERIQFRPNWLPVNMTLYGDAFFQNPDGNKWIPLDGKQEWSTTWIGSIHQKRDFTPKTFHIPRFSALFRGMSLDSTEDYDLRTIDQDIFTTYTSDHRQIFEFSDTLYHRPWLDSIAYAGGDVANNEKLNILYSKINLGWQQLLGPFQAGFSYQYAKYYPEDFLRRTYGFDLLWQKWCDSLNWYEIKFQIQQDIDAPATTGFLVFTWRNSNGRGFRDFAPEPFQFRDIRQREIPSWPNNTIKVD
ncbi:hypothetical protein [Legionella impletisoli]|uniref:hypothetical protein n=1 Tax=Legionella impletisoli TaxID=343510 RepID=UPI001A9420E3|nr:hypothetical protein [Legionella impletisoli]